MLIPINGAGTVTLTVFYDRLHRFPIHYWQMWYQKYISAHSRLTFKWKVLTERISFGRNKNVNAYHWCCDFYLDSFFLIDICSLNIIYKYGIEKKYECSFEADIQAENFNSNNKFLVQQKCLYLSMGLWLMPKLLCTTDMCSLNIVDKYGFEKMYGPIWVWHSSRMFYSVSKFLMEQKC